MKRLGYLLVLASTGLFGAGCGHHDDDRGAHAVKVDADRAAQDAGRAAHDAVQTAHDVQHAVEADVVRGIDRADGFAAPAPLVRDGGPDHSQDAIAHQEKRLGEDVKREASDAAAAEAKLLTEKLFNTK
ncbi:MAG TPA: hypothetical protein VGY55_13925 [Pirellulales bacterium]|nr:hypothetical protein [Pirellulales bacterium]